MFSNPQKGAAHILLLILIIAGLAVSVYVLGIETKIFPKAYEQKSAKNNTWEETIFPKKENQKAEATSIQTNTESANKNLPQPSTWRNMQVQVVPDSFFNSGFKESSAGITAIQAISDGRLFLGQFNIFAIKNPDDKNWQHLGYYKLKLRDNQHTNIKYFVQTRSQDSDKPEVYFGYEKVVRLKKDGTYEIVVDPTDAIGYLRNAKIIPYSSNDAVAAYRDNELYYLEKGTLRKWLSPHSYGCSDKILNMFTDPFSKKTYGIITEYSSYAFCGPNAQTHLYEFIFTSNPKIPLQANRLGQISNATILDKAVVSMSKDNQGQKILYGFKKYVNKLYLISNFDPLKDLTLESQNIDPDIQSAPSMGDLEIALKNTDTDSVWAAAEQVKGMYLGQNFDNGKAPAFLRTEDTAILANPYINDLTVDNMGNVLVAHQYLPSQFNQAMVTIFQTPSQTLPTPPLPAIVGQAVSLDGQSYINAADQNQKLGVTNDFTIETWIKPFNSQDLNYIIGRYSSAFGTRYKLFLYVDSRNNKADLRFSVPGLAGMSDALTIIPLNEWIHVAAVKEGNTIRGYINGVKAFEVTGTAGNLSDEPGSITTLGAWKIPTFTGYKFKGLIDDLRVSNTARDVTTNWNNGIYFQSLTSDSNTLALWKFENNLNDSGSNIIPTSGTGNILYESGKVAP